MQAFTTVEQLLARCEIAGDCAIWTSYRSGGVPIVRHKGKSESVRRVMAEIIGKARPGGFWSTSCGEGRCVTPEHMVWHSKRKHGQIMAKKLQEAPAKEMLRRQKIAAKSRRLPSEIVQAIMASDEPGTVLAARLGVSEKAVSNYRRQTHFTATGMFTQLLNPLR